MWLFPLCTLTLGLVEGRHGLVWRVLIVAGFLCNGGRPTMTVSPPGGVSLALHTPERSWGTDANTVTMLVGTVDRPGVRGAACAADHYEETKYARVARGDGLGG